MANISYDQFTEVGKKTDGTVLIRAVIWAASTSDVPAYNAIGDGKILVAGSAAVIPSAGKLLFLDFDNTWKEWGEA